MDAHTSTVRAETPEPVVVKLVYGLIRQVNKKSGEEGQGIPMHAGQMTMGRDLDCNIRIYQESVSRRHVELDIDPITCQATLTVVGRSPVTYMPASGSKTKLKTGTTQQLSSGDRFSLQKFVFAYEAVNPHAYHAESIASIQTPLAPSRAQNTPGPATPSSPIPQRVPAKIALSTPKGRMSLLKHTVLQSARKQWIAQKPTGLEGAVEDGSIEVRRKSTSPNKAVVPMDEDSEEEDLPEEQHAHVTDEHVDAPAQEDDGQGADAYDEDAEDSLEADLSLDIAEEDDRMDIDPALYTGDIPAASYAAEEGSAEVGDFEMEGDAEEAEEAEDDQELEDGFEEVPIHDAAPATPPARPLSAFYTPQVRNNAQAAPRRSLAGIGGPAWRPAQFNQPTNPLASPAVRMTGAGRQVKAERDEKEQIHAKHEVAVTPVKKERAIGGGGLSAAELDEMKKRRQSLGTPRALPSAPASFKTPAPAFSFSKTVQSVHPALTPSTSAPVAVAAASTPIQSRSRTENDTLHTPLQNIRKQLDSLRLQAEERSSRRMSMGNAALGVAPSSSAPVLAYATPARTHRIQRPAAASSAVPLAPTLEAEEGDMSVSSISLATPTRPGGTGTGTPFRWGPPSRAATPARASATPAKAASLSPSQSPVSPAQSPARVSPRTSTMPTRPPKQASALMDTPDYSGLKHMMPARAPAATPSLAGLRQMYPSQSTRAQPATPQYTGVRQLYPAVPAAPATPDLQDMSELFSTPPSSATWANRAEQAKAEVIVSPVKEWHAVETRTQDHDQEQDEDRYGAVTEFEDSEEEEEEPIEYVPLQRRATRQSQSPVKPSEPAVKLLSSTASLSAASRCIPARSTRQATSSPVKLAQTVEASEPRTVNRTRTKTASPVKQVGSSGEEDEESEDVEPAKKAPVKATAGPRRPTARAARTTTAEPVDAAQTVSAPARTTRKKADVALGETGVQGSMPDKPSAPARSVKGRTAKAVKEEPTDEVQSAPAPARRTRTAASTSAATKAAPAKTSAPTRATRATRSKVSVDDEEKENVAVAAERPSRSTRSRR